MVIHSLGETSGQLWLQGLFTLLKWNLIKTRNISFASKCNSSMGLKWKCSLTVGVTPLVPPAAHSVLLYMWPNCVPECLGSKPLSCGVRFSSLFIFPLLVSLSASILFPSSHDKHSGLLIGLGKNKTSSSLHLRKGKATFDKRPPPHRQKAPAGRRRPGMAPRRRCDGRS